MTNTFFHDTKESYAHVISEAHVLLILTLLNSAIAACPIQSTYSPTERTDIAATDLSTIFTLAQGCLTVVEIWASWCGPCVQIAPSVAAFHERFPTVSIISISADATAGAAEQFWKKYPPIGPKLRFTQWTLSDLSTSFSTVGASFPEAIPYFVVLDPAGKLLYETHEPKSLDALSEVVEKQLSEQEAAK